MIDTIDSRVDELLWIFYFFKNIPFKFLHSCEKNSGVDDKRFARSSIVLRSGPFVPAIDMTLEVQEKSFIRLLSVDMGFQAVDFDDLHANEW